MKMLLNNGVVFVEALLLISFSVNTHAQDAKSAATPQLGKNSIPQIVAAMTLEEKAKLVVGMGREPKSAKIPEKVPGSAGRTYPLMGFGIPSITMSDGPAGVRIPPIRNHDSSKTYYATAFPVETLLASTWDTSVVRKVGDALGSEAHEYGIDIMLLPAMDIQRNPLGGRNFEYYSEDPLVSGEMAAAMVRGIQSNGVGATIKHFFANNQETSRMSINEVISERAIREIYLKGFEIAVKESQPWAVMSSYNKVNGTYTSQRRDLLTDILRNEWGFKGFVMTDWGGGDNPVAQMKAGNDLLMPGTPLQSQAIVNAVKKRKLDVHVLDLNVERILEGILKTPEFTHYAFSNRPDLRKDALVSRWAATQGMVLLKDRDRSLPLKHGNKIALFGYTSYDLLAGGYGSGSVNKAYNISLNKGLSDAGYMLNQTLQTAYENYITREKTILPKKTSLLEPPAIIPEMVVNTSMIKESAMQDGGAIITIGRNSGEGRDRNVSDFYLSKQEKELIKNVSDIFHAHGKKVVVILNIAGPIEIASWRNEVDGILLAWMPGQQGGNAIAEVLSGKVDPSGKLAQTFPIKYSDVPSAKYFPGTPANRPEQVVYGEGIYVGYRYYNTFHIKTAYPFGYGLSYTHFTYSNLSLSSKRFYHEITATVKITNSGSVPGKEVAELYLSAPQKELKKPEEELKAFAKTKMLQPGESETLTFTLDPMSLASYYTKKESWIAEAGEYWVKIGASSTNIREKASFTLTKNLVVEKDYPALAPQMRIPAFKQ